MNTQTQFKCKKNDFTPVLHIPEFVEGKIRHLCARVHNTEWSGILFYTTRGSFEDKTFSIECLDFYPMDIGSEGATEFKDTPDIATYRVEHPFLLQESVYEALIHSHNNMAAFFSSTDNGTLTTEGEERNHFLSLIVNNAGNYVARITRNLVTENRVKAHIVSTKNVYYNTFKDETVILEKDKVEEKDVEDTKTTNIVEYFDCIIDKEDTDEPYKELNERIDDLKKPKKKETVRYYDKGFDKGYYGNSLFDDYDDWTQYTSAHSLDGPEVSSDLERAIEDVCVRLVTGSMLAKVADFVPEKWLNIMDDRFRFAFGDLDNNELFDEWMSITMDFLVNWIVDDEYLPHVVVGDVEDLMCAKLKEWKKINPNAEALTRMIKYLDLEYEQNEIK